MSDSQLASFSVSKAVSQLVLSQSVRRSVTQFVSFQCKSAVSYLLHVSQLLTQSVSNCYLVNLSVCQSGGQSVSQYVTWSVSLPVS